MATWHHVPNTAHTRVGPYITTSAYIFDSVNPYVYYAHNNGATDGTGGKIKKINRSTLLTENEITVSNNQPFIRNLQEDTNYLYIGYTDSIRSSHSSFPSVDATTSRIIKYNKSDLSEVARVTHTSSNNECLFNISLGRGWNAGKIWGLYSMFDSSSPPFWGHTHLVSWDSSTLTEVDNLHITTAEDVSGTGDELLQPIHAVYNYTIDPTGDIYLLGNGVNGYTVVSAGYILYESCISKINSSLAISTFKDFPAYPSTGHIRGRNNVFVGDADALHWNDADNTLIFFCASDYPDLFTSNSGIVQLNSSGTVITERTFTNIHPSSGSQIIYSWGSPAYNNGIYSIFLNEYQPHVSDVEYDITYHQIRLSDLTTYQTLSVPSTLHGISGITMDSGETLWGQYDGLYVYGDYVGSTSFDEKIFAYGMAAGLGRGWA